MLRPAEDRNFWRGRGSRKLHLLIVTFLVPEACNPRSERKGLDASSSSERHNAPCNWLDCAVVVSWPGLIHDGAWTMTTWRFLKVAINCRRELGVALGYKRRRLLTVGMISRKVCWRVGKSKSVIETWSRVREQM